MEKVTAIFDEVQRIPSASNKSCIPKLNKILDGEAEEERGAILQGIWRGCLDRCLLCAKKEHLVDKMIDFLSSFVSSKATNDIVFSSCIDHLLMRSQATEKVVRLRTCQMILRVIIGTTESVKEVSEVSIKSIIDTLLPRLRDKVPGVRVWAVKILSNLQMEAEGITEELIRLLQSDSSKDVRVATVESICLSKITLPHVIARVTDVRPEVRIAVYTRLSSKHILAKNMDAPSAALIVRFGLGDRNDSVKESCKMLILKWLNDYKNDVPKFLRLMDFEMYEEEAESLGYAVMEIVDRSETVSHELSVAVRQHAPHWETSVSKLVSSEILWSYIRCSYAKNNMSAIALSDFVDALVPEMVKICGLLQDARKPALYSSARCQMIVRYLLRLTTFLDTSDICGCLELKKVCEEMLCDTNLPEMLVDPMLSSWLLASSFPSSSQSIEAAVALSIKVIRVPGSAPQSKPRVSDEYALPGDSDDEVDEDIEERLNLLSSIRSLQIISWSVQQNIGARDTVKGCERYNDVIDFIMECLQQPSPDLRGLSVKCLGLLALTSEDKCKELSEIIFQVARNEIEEGEIRSQALEALVDMAVIYEKLYQNDLSLTAFLLLLQEGSEPALLRVGAESSAKLLFSGRLSDPKLFANLLKFFFLPNLSGNGREGGEEEYGGRRDSNNSTEGEGENGMDHAYLGSQSRLQQILSLFFQSFFMGGSVRDSVAFGCTSDLISNLAMLVRDGDLEPTSMTKMCTHLLGLCESIKLPISEEYSGEYSSEEINGVKNYTEIARNIFRIRLSAAICREILKMGNSVCEKQATKEFIKCLATLSPSSWILKKMARTVLSVMSTIYQTCSLEKASQKILLEKIISVCESVGDFSSFVGQEEIEMQSRDEFYNYAPGLAIMMELGSQGVSDEKTEELRVNSRSYIVVESSRTTLAKKKVRKSTEKDDDEDEDDEEDDDEDDENEDENENEKHSAVPSGRRGPSRGSKEIALNRISDQITAPEDKLNKRLSKLNI